MEPERVFTELQCLQLRSQILVYSALLQGRIPEEELMIGAFSDISGGGVEDSNVDDGRSLWQELWLTSMERVHGGVITATPQARAKLHTWRPGTSITAAPPRAVRSALHPVGDEDLVASGTELENPDGAAREQTMELYEEQTKASLEAAETAAASAQEQCEDLHEFLRQHCVGDQTAPELASAAITMKAAASVAEAAATAAKLSFEAASRAKQAANSTDLWSPGEAAEEEFEGEVHQALSLAFAALFQAQTALMCGSNPSINLQDLSPRESEPALEMEALKEKDVSEGFPVEVMSKRSRVWRTTEVVTVQEGIVQVVNEDCRKEWIAIECEPGHRPNVRRPHPKCRSDSTNEMAETWMVGDLVDARVPDGWKEGVVSSVSRDDCNSAIVFFSGEGRIQNVKTSDLRRSLLWQDNKWILGGRGADQEGKGLYLETMTEQQTSTGPPISYKMRNIIDVMLEESEKLKQTGQQQEKARQRKRKALVEGAASNGYKRVKKQKQATSGTASKVRKAKILINKATVPRQSFKRIASSGGGSSKMVFTKRYELLREMVRLKTFSKQSPQVTITATTTLTAAAASAEAHTANS